MSDPTRILGQNVLCFSHDWTGDPLSKTHLMRLLAQHNRVLWINSIGYRTPNLTTGRDWGRVVRKLKQAATALTEVEPNLFVVTPLVIPAWGHASIRALNRRLLAWQVRRAMRRLRMKSPLNFVFNPAAGVLAGHLGEKAVIYYCVDEYTAFVGVDRAALTLVEQHLLDRADLVIVSAAKLLETKRSPRGPTVLVRHGVDYQHFRTALEAATPIPDDVAGLPKPVIGYFGLLADDWVDVPLLVQVARQFPTGTLVLVGKSTMDLSPLEREPNVRILGRKPYATLPGYCKTFDVGLIPFPISEVTLSANPLKAREYLAAGLPVVSTAIPEVKVLTDCRIGHTAEEFVLKIQEALNCPESRAARSDKLQNASWAARLAEVAGHLQSRGVLA